ncbi:MAG: hypothetical protein LC792_02150 [Actinobacteria bacterium]|nr:hypothetical protein [Actinomycetota bacterium]
MKRITTALAAATLLVTLAAPAEAAVVPRPVDARHGSVHGCDGPSARWHRGDCHDEHEPQHDGRGSILF